MFLAWFVDSKPPRLIDPGGVTKGVVTIDGGNNYIEL